MLALRQQSSGSWSGDLGSMPTGYRLGLSPRARWRPDRIRRCHCRPVAARSTVDWRSPCDTHRKSSKAAGWALRARAQHPIPICSYQQTHRTGSVVNRSARALVSLYALLCLVTGWACRRSTRGRRLLRQRRTLQLAPHLTPAGARVRRCSPHPACSRP